MATIVQQVYAEQASGSASQTITLSQALSTGSTVVVLTGFGRTGGTPAISSVVNNGTANTYLQAVGAAASQTTANPRMHTDIWFCDNVNAGATIVTVTFNTISATTSFIGVVEFLSTMAPSIVEAGGRVGTTTPATGGSVTIVGGELMMSCIIVASGSVSSVDSPWSALSGAITFMVATYDGAAAGTYAPTYTLSGNVRWASSSAEADFTSNVPGASNILLKKVT